MWRKVAPNIQGTLGAGAGGHENFSPYKGGGEGGTFLPYKGGGAFFST